MNGRPKRFGTLPDRYAVSRGLIYLLVLLVIGVATRTTIALYHNKQIHGIADKSAKLLESENEKAEEYVELYSKKVEELKDKGIFAPPKKPEAPPPQVAGILGNSVLINGQWCSVGQEHAGAKIIKIEPTEVTILWKGNEMKLAPILASRPPGPAAKEPPKPEPKQPVEKPQPAVEVQVVERQEQVVEPVQQTDDSLGWMGVELTYEMRDFITRMFEIMPADQIDEAKSEWAEMSDEDKEEALSELQEMIDNGQAEQMLQQMQSREY